MVVTYKAPEFTESLNLIEFEMGLDPVHSEEQDGVLSNQSKVKSINNNRINLHLS